MIDLSVQRIAGAPRTLRIFGIGSAGANVLDRMVLDGVSASHLVAINTEAQALQASVAGQKVQIGEAATRGLGTGGDPELGRAAAEEGFYLLRSAVKGLDAVFLLGGLGGGTASGSLPVMAELAREEGALVIAFVTLPFGFEGKRRQEQAHEALARLKKHAHAVICFENDMMGDQTGPRAGIAQAFAVADQILSQSIRAVAALFYRKGLVNLGFDDLKAALAGNQARTLFAHGEAEGNNRPYDALAKALKSPLMDKGRLLRECEIILVQVTGGPDMTLTEVELLMEEFNRKVEQRSRLLFGVAVDSRSEGRMSVTLFATLAEDVEVAESALSPTGERARHVTSGEVQSPPLVPAVEPVLHGEKSQSISKEIVAPARGDGLDAIFAASAAAAQQISVLEEVAPSQPLPEKGEREEERSLSNTGSESPGGLKVVIEEEASDFEPLVPRADVEDTPPPALPSFVIEEEEGEAEDDETLSELTLEADAIREQEQPPSMVAPLRHQYAFEEAETEADEGVIDEPIVLIRHVDEGPAREEPFTDAAPVNEGEEPHAPVCTEGEEELSEPQTSLFQEEDSIFSRPFTPAVRPQPGRTLGESSPFFKEPEPESLTSYEAPHGEPIPPKSELEARDERVAAAPPPPNDEPVDVEVPITWDGPIPCPARDGGEDVGNGESGWVEPVAAGDAPPDTFVSEKETSPTLAASASVLPAEDDGVEEDIATEPPSPRGEATLQEEPVPPQPQPLPEREGLQMAAQREKGVPTASGMSERSPALETPAKAPQQETLKFESTQRGRFEKSEPTIVDGQDLDVPTYLRRNIKIRPQ